MAGILPNSWEEEHSDDPDAVQPKYSLPWTYFKFITKFTNMLDFVTSILPLILIDSPDTASSQFIRVLRLLRVARLIKLLSLLNNSDVATSLISETMYQAATMLSVFLFFVLVSIVFFGCLIYFFEAGTYTVNSTYPHGAYLREKVDEDGQEVTPFSSIAIGMYWAIGQVTGTGR